MLEVTDVKIRKVIPEGRLRAIISLTFDDALAIHDIKLIQGDERMFVAMPSRRDEMGTFRDIIHPINPEARIIIEKAVLKAYDEYLESEGLENINNFKSEPPEVENKETEVLTSPFGELPSELLGF